MLTVCPIKTARIAYRNCFKVTKFMLIAGLIMSASALKADQLDNTKEYMLENGLKIIVRPDHRAPTAVTQIWYKVGSSYEPNGITGISHALEHMMFRGTPNYPGDKFSKLIAIGGGDQNAFTSTDYTGYYQELSPNQLELCFQLEADRMNNLSLKKEDFEQEIKVVKEERRMRTEDNPDAYAYERLQAAAYISNPYHHPTVGWMNDLNNMKVEDLRSWYKQWYGPNNATVMVVGDVNPQHIFELAKKSFGHLKPITLPPVKPRLEISSVGERRLVVHKERAIQRLFMAYNTPNISTAEAEYEPYALMVLMMSLDGSNSARFTQNLIRKNIATSIFSGYSPFRLHESLMIFSGIPLEGHTLQDVEQGFLDEVDKLKNTLISDGELQRVKTQVIADQIYALDSMTDQATEIGALESIFLPWQLSEKFPDNIKSVTAQQVQSVAQKYLTTDRLTVAHLVPEEGKSS